MNMRLEEQQPKENAGKLGLDNKGFKFEGIDVKQDTLPGSQDAQAKYVQDDLSSIIDRMLSIAKEICVLSEHKVPAESDSTDAVPQMLHHSK